MNYSEWEESVPEEIRKDALWNMKTYRLALFMAEIGWRDTTKLAGDIRTRNLADQLYRSLGSVSANIAEGYSRSSSKERAHFYEYSLGSARESRDWYYKARHILGEPVANHRIQLLTEIIRLLLTIIPAERKAGIREAEATYHSADLPNLSTDPWSPALASLFQEIPDP